MLTDAERQQLLIDWNQTAVAYPKDRCVHELIEEQAELAPEAVAVVFEDAQLTYRQLNERANQLAHHLQELGVGPDTLVAICVERSLEMVVGLLGILKAGGAYLPLDPSYPKERLAFMLRDSGTPLLLTHQRLRDQLQVEPKCQDSLSGRRLGNDRQVTDPESQVRRRAREFGVRDLHLRIDWRTQGRGARRMEGC